jgi:hypothetical protein
MPISYKQVFDKIKKRLGFARNVDFKVIDTKSGTLINRKTHVKTSRLGSYLLNFEDNARVATFLSELQRRIGAPSGTKIGIWVAGHRIDGRRGVASLR